jgi:hypothetical protein
MVLRPLLLKTSGIPGALVTLANVQRERDVCSSRVAVALVKTGVW